MYKSFISHLHSIFEGPGSVSGHCYEASRFDIDAVWLHDHDTQIAAMAGRKNPPFTALDCQTNANERVELTAEAAGEHSHWSFRHRPTQQCFLLEAAGTHACWGGVQVNLTRVTRRPLFTRPTLYLEIDTSAALDDADARFCLEVPLNQTPPAHSRPSMHYYLGPPLDEPASFSLAERRQGAGYRIDLAADAEQAGLGFDHTANTFIFRLESLGRKVTAKLTAFSIATELTDSADWQSGQEQLAREAEQRYGLKVICGYEFSDGESHMCYYGPPAPVYPYHQHPTKPTMQELTQYAAAHGGITCCNHPLSAKKKNWDAQEKMLVLERKIKSLITSQAGGAALIEIGFPCGRRGFTLRQHLYLWDALNLAGMRIYGIGVNDAHSNVPWEEGREGNNFANYVEADNCQPETLTAGLRSGRFYMADPVVYKGSFSLTTDDGKTMGDTQTGGQAVLKLTQVPNNALLSWVIDGQTVRTETVSDTVESQCPLAGEHFIRAELAQPDGRTILLTNPIWTS